MTAALADCAMSISASARFDAIQQIARSNAILTICQNISFLHRETGGSS
jgi:hypothetical protein